MKIILGVSASIALYRACDIVRELTKAGHSVRVAMTRTAQSWINPVLFEALSGNEVYTDANEGSRFGHNQDTSRTSHGMAHIEIREGADLMLVAPATADLVARAAQGMANCIVTATLLSFGGPRFIAPAMNPFMYSHPATQKNLKTLAEFGYHILDAASGEAVCGDAGQGKMMAVKDIIAAITNLRA
ncbi:MAG: Coenzyme A biosynthesis bifunctional protein CoaBC [Turneriella sp.]|nr:Coenzyme A biosynthesis bifunctional protein CoaBC [Turneriella sp.]